MAVVIPVGVNVEAAAPVDDTDVTSIGVVLSTPLNEATITDQPDEVELIVEVVAYVSEWRVIDVAELKGISRTCEDIGKEVKRGMFNFFFSSRRRHTR